MTVYFEKLDTLQQQLAWRLSALVELETPTSEKEAVDVMGQDIAAWASNLGANVVTHEQSIVGDFVECRWHEDKAEKPILILCHMDTVHPLGSVEKRPTTIKDDVLYGVGSYDMKAGIAVVQVVIENLIMQGQFPDRPITLFFNSDEEIGSVYSRHTIEQLAKDAGLVLVMEFCNYAEDIVVGRKGVGIFQITSFGREAHSGGDPKKGINAIVELAHQTDPILELADWDKGTLVTPTIIKGGTRHNVIPGTCEMVINVRVKTQAEAQRVDDGLMEITENPSLENAELILTGDFMRPPMEFTDVTESAIETLSNITGEFINYEIRGEGSDANFSAALGIPTFCGMGPSGEGAHAVHEQVYLPSMPRRANLLASILCDWPTMPSLSTTNHTEDIVNLA